MDVIGWLNANSGAVQGVATIVLVVITAYYAWQTRRQVAAMQDSMREGQRAAVRPIVRPSSLDAEQSVYPKNIADLALVTDPRGFRDPPPLLVENVGPGLAASIQWQITFPKIGSRDEPEPLVRREHTYALRLATGESAWLWQSLRDEGLTIMDGHQLTLWYDDVLGNHYIGIFNRLGPNWVTVEPGKRIEQTPQLFQHRAF